MPASPDAVHRLIEREFDALSPELQRAARWLRQNEKALALRSMRASARAAGVSPATMTRLAQRLGFQGFEALRAPYVERLAGDAPAFLQRAQVQQKRGAAHEALARLSMLQQANVASVAALNSAPAIDAAADALLAAERVLFLGLRACLGIAFLLHYTYGLLRANGALVTDTAGTLADQMAQADRDTVLVAVSMAPYTRQTVDATAAARRHGAQVVALTDAVLSPIARGAEHVLLFEAETNSFLHSKTGAVALAEALIAAVTARGGEPVIEHLRRMQHHLRSSHAYWERSHRRHPE